MNAFLRHIQELHTFKNGPVFFGPPCTYRQTDRQTDMLPSKLLPLLFTAGKDVVLCCGRELALVSSTKERRRNVPVREQLFEYVISEHGDMIAIYASVPSFVVKVKSVADRVSDGWHFVLRSEVTTMPS